MDNMIPYNPKVVHVEVGIQKVSFIRKNRYDNHRKENNCGDDSSMVFLYDKHLGYTIIAGNSDLDLIEQSRNCHKYHHSQNY